MVAKIECAKELNKPVYVICESFKFVRLYPLNQKDLPDEFKVREQQKLIFKVACVVRQ